MKQGAKRMNIYKLNAHFWTGCPKINDVVILERSKLDPTVASRLSKIPNFLYNI